MDTVRHIYEVSLCVGIHTYMPLTLISILGAKHAKISLLTIGTIIIDLFPSSVAKWMCGAKHSPWEKKYLLMFSRHNNKAVHSYRQACRDAAHIMHTGVWPVWPWLYPVCRVPQEIAFILYIYILTETCPQIHQSIVAL